MSVLEQTPPHPKHILLIDDEEDLSKMRQKILQRLGYKITICSESTKVPALLDDPTLQFDLIVTDMLMPGLNGLEVARLCHQRYPNLPIILLTGYIEGIEAQSLEEAGILKLLKKTILKKQFCEEIQKTLAPPKDHNTQP